MAGKPGSTRDERPYGKSYSLEYLEHPTASCLLTRLPLVPAVTLTTVRSSPCTPQLPKRTQAASEPLTKSQDLVAAADLATWWGQSTVMTTFAYLPGQGCVTILCIWNVRHRVNH